MQLTKNGISSIVKKPMTEKQPEKQPEKQQKSDPLFYVLTPAILAFLFLFNIFAGMHFYSFGWFTFIFCFLGLSLLIFEEA